MSFPTNEVEFSRPRSLVSLATEHIRDRIIRGRYSFGEQLSEAAIAKEFGTSKTPVREAMLHLKKEGLVDVVPQTGTFVFSPTPQDISEMCYYRKAIEKASLLQAYEIDPVALANRLTPIFGSMTSCWKSNSWSEYLEFDHEFHKSIVMSSNNRYLMAGYKIISGVTSALRYRSIRKTSDSAETLGDHENIIDMINRKDIDFAMSILDGHIDALEVAISRIKSK